MQMVQESEGMERNAITYETVSGQAGGVEIDGGVPVLYVNREGCEFLAQLFSQLAAGHCDRGFHVHLGENLNPEAPEVIRVVLE